LGDTLLAVVPLSTAETADCVTPAWAAMSFIVTAIRENLALFDVSYYYIIYILYRRNAINWIKYFFNKDI
jgi:hypothetical protein